MTSSIQPLRGMNDVLPDQIAHWQFLEQTAREVFASYGYLELRLPLLEETALFKRAIGEFTDIVEKEMFTFDDRDGDSVTLRPEATAGMVRAMITNGLLHNQKHRLWTAGAMFRGERPQKGRYRQFHQLDVEAFGYEGPDIDAELILMSARLWQRLGIQRVRLELNSLGTRESRQVYREQLTRYFTGHQAALDADSQRRLQGNPLRILDSKNPDMAEIVRGAPLLTDSLDVESRAHFAGLCAMLDDAGVDYTLNPRLVRGLDYYSRTVFEWVTDALGSQNAVCSGGRYDGLVQQLGGEPTPAIGWALGEERIVLLMQESGIVVPGQQPDAYIVMVGAAAERAGLRIAEQLRTAHPGLRVQAGVGGGSFKSQFKRADKSGAALAIILGEDEVAAGKAALKPLRHEAPQVDCAFGQLPQQVGALLGRA